MIGIGNRAPLTITVGGSPLRGEGEAGTVALTPEEMEAARQHAIRVNANAARHGWQHKYDLPDETHLDTQIRGFAAEMAVAKYLGVEWQGWLPREINSRVRKRADVAGIEVRNSRYDGGKLAIYPNDPDDQPCLLVTGTGPVFRLVGWCYPPEGRNPAWTATFGSFHYRVPQFALRPITTLPKEATNG